MSSLKLFIKENFFKYIAQPFIRKDYIKNIRTVFDYDKPAPTILTSNCIGGEIYNDLGLKFTSPTINLWFHESDFLKIVLNPQHYFSQKLVFTKESGITYPVAFLDDVKVYFTHYETEESAAEKWYSRCKRIDYDNIYIVMSDLRISESEFQSFQNITCCRRKIMFTSNPEHKGYTDVFKVDMYNDYSYIRDYANNTFNGYRNFEKFFDFAHWLNDEDFENDIVIE